MWVGAALVCSPVLFYLGSPGEGWLFQPPACSIALSPGSPWEEGREDAKEDRDRKARSWVRRTVES